MHSAEETGNPRSSLQEDTSRLVAALGQASASQENTARISDQAARGSLDFLLPGDRVTMPEPQTTFPIRHSEWAKLYRRVREIENPIPFFASAGLAFVGIAIGAGLSFMAWTAAFPELPATQRTHYEWVGPLMVIGAVAAILLAVICGVASYIYTQDTSYRKRHLLEDMDALYAPFRHGARPPK